MPSALLSPSHPLHAKLRHAPSGSRQSVPTALPGQALASPDAPAPRARSPERASPVSQPAAGRTRSWTYQAGALPALLPAPPPRAEGGGAGGASAGEAGGEEGRADATVLEAGACKRVLLPVNRRLFSAEALRATAEADEVEEPGGGRHSDLDDATLMKRTLDRVLRLHWRSISPHTPPRARTHGCTRRTRRCPGSALLP